MHVAGVVLAPHTTGRAARSTPIPLIGTVDPATARRWGGSGHDACRVAVATRLEGDARSRLAGRFGGGCRDGGARYSPSSIHVLRPVPGSFCAGGSARQLLPAGAGDDRRRVAGRVLPLRRRRRSATRGRATRGGRGRASQLRRLDGICRLRSEPDVAGQRSRDVGRRAGGHRRRPHHRRGPHSRPGGAGRGLRQRAVR